MTSLFKLNELRITEPVRGFKVKYLDSENMTFAYVDVDAGAVLPEHHHLQEQVATVIAGKFEYTVDGVRHSLEPGTVIMIPANAIHSGRAITACWIIEAFYPMKKEK